MEWNRTAHSANSTDNYLFSQLIPYIGNKRKLLPLIARAIAATGENPRETDFVDLFSGTGVVSRMAKKMGFRVIANDWEPYGEILNLCYLATQGPPVYFDGVAYADVIARLNALPPVDGWVTRHLCPDDDVAYDVARDRMFYMRKNGRRIDAMREQIARWEDAGMLSPTQRACLLAPLLFSACYNSNTSGLFKGFHNGWGGQTGTALYRIAGDLCLRPAMFVDNGCDNVVLRADAQEVAQDLGRYLSRPAIAYIDPPYNQHPYGANYHVLNSIALWDRPALSPKISGRDKAAIRTDWRTVRRSAYNYRDRATRAYARLLNTLPVRWIATSYSTDGMIALRDMVAANHALGEVRVFSRGYKRYRVSSQRFSRKPMNVEFILLTQVGQACAQSVDMIVEEIRTAEARILASHPETATGPV
ncbi:DNA adenine methylase [Novacetimonas pomaceti]|uniref:DNA adenine methylase n=1 Tax=Novacetimonas pomaceti TaxID=2021998 RepID=UPI001C2D9EA2|nr:DNA adenine methylase [Novacetimonas pomaceti]MBV1835097.1 DNA adenine methylase [Novacetimonas pomaceti]